jgi:hypothetical protein
MISNKLNNLNNNNDFSGPGIIGELFDIIKSIVSMDRGDENTVGLSRYKEFKPCLSSQKRVNTKHLNQTPFRMAANTHPGYRGKAQMPGFIENKF